MPTDRCPQCARELDQHVRFTLPQPVLDMPEQERTPGIWLSHETPGDSVMMQVPNAGAFVRVLLPIKLTAGHTLTYGVWLAIHPDDLGPIFAAWWAPTYADLRITGWLANPIPPWGLLAAPTTATVRNPDHTPYCDQSTDPVLTRVLTEEWPHDTVFGGGPDGSLSG